MTPATIPTIAPVPGDEEVVSVPEAELVDGGAVVVCVTVTGGGGGNDVLDVVGVARGCSTVRTRQ